MQLKIFQTTMVIIFWQFTVFWYKHDLPELKWDLISIITDFVLQLPHELLKGLRLSIIEN